MELDIDEGGIEVVVPNDEKELHVRMVSENNNGGVDGKKTILQAKKWYFYN